MHVCAGVFVHGSLIPIRGESMSASWPSSWSGLSSKRKRKNMSTKLWARIFGLWSLLVVVGMVVNRENTIDVVNGFFASAALMWTTGIFTSLVGIVVIVTHNRWSGGALPVIVTLFGWLVLVKGLAFVWLTASAEQAFYNALHFNDYFYFYFILSLAIGIYLTYSGFKAESIA